MPNYLHCTEIGRERRQIDKQTFLVKFESSDTWDYKNSRKKGEVRSPLQQRPDTLDSKTATSQDPQGPSEKERCSRAKSKRLRS